MSLVISHLIKKNLSDQIAIFSAVASSRAASFSGFLSLVSKYAFWCSISSISSSVTVRHFLDENGNLFSAFSSSLSLYQSLINVCGVR